MGYTHHWYRPKTIKRSAWDVFKADVEKILANLPKLTPTAGGYYADAPVVVRFEDDNIGPPQVDDELVRFNGIGEMGHETFFVTRTVTPEKWDRPKHKGLFFAFCKTARKPYDVAVVACLCALKAAEPEVELSSDGDANERKEGAQLFKDATGKEPPVWDCDLPECATCKGDGYANGQYDGPPCSTCGGSGHVSRPAEVEVS